MSSVNQPMPDNLITRWFETPIGPMEIGVVDHESVSPKYWYFEFMNESQLSDHKNSAKHPLLDLAELQLRQYFYEGRVDFSELIQYFSDYGTEFQKQVWQGLMEIPFGETRSYGELATALNNPKAVRAVGAANGKNPLAVVVPCHRVIGANGTLTGYAGGLDKKQWLLEFEQAQQSLL